MPYVTSLEQNALDRGRAEGMVEERRTLVLRQVEKRFGPLDETTRTRIAQADGAVLADLALALFDLTSLHDLQQWLADRGDA